MDTVLLAVANGGGGDRSLVSIGGFLILGSIFSVLRKPGKHLFSHLFSVGGWFCSSSVVLSLQSSFYSNFTVLGSVLLTWTIVCKVLLTQTLQYCMLAMVVIQDSTKRDKIIRQSTDQAKYKIQSTKYKVQTRQSTNSKYKILAETYALNIGSPASRIPI